MNLKSYFTFVADEYFLSNVKTIDDLTATRKSKLLSVTTWTSRMVYSIETWPCYNIISDLGMANLSQICCTGCNMRGIMARVILYGQPYNPNTVEVVVQPDHRIAFDKVNYIYDWSIYKMRTFLQYIHSYYSIIGSSTMSHMFITL